MNKTNLVTLRIDNEGSDKPHRLQLGKQFGHKASIELVFENSARADCAAHQRSMADVERYYKIRWTFMCRLDRWCNRRFRRFRGWNFNLNVASFLQLFIAQCFLILMRLVVRRFIGGCRIWVNYFTLGDDFHLAIYASHDPCI